MNRNLVNDEERNLSKSLQKQSYCVLFRDKKLGTAQILELHQKHRKIVKSTDRVIQVIPNTAITTVKLKRHYALEDA